MMLTVEQEKEANEIAHRLLKFVNDTAKNDPRAYANTSASFVLVVAMGRIFAQRIADLEVRLAAVEGR